MSKGKQTAYEVALNAEGLLEKYREAYEEYGELWHVAQREPSDEAISMCHRRAEQVEQILLELRPLLLASPEGKQQWRRVQRFLSPCERKWRHEQLRCRDPIFPAA
jgi:hypothetical protein